jgi:4-amino-4-deoxy-L-arabinose transferase-like glycosyltransferase
MHLIKQNTTLIAILLLCYISIFYHLTQPAIFIWDEAIYGNNALEMAIHKDFFVLKNNGLATLYNVKPPLVIWLQCLCIWLFGANELAIRLPSALGALVTCGLVFAFAKRNFNLTIALFSVLFLVTTQGYIRTHVARTGDLDSVLVCFITAYSLLIFHVLLNSIENHRKYLPFIGLLVYLAFLSKSVAGLMPILGLSFGVLSTKKGRAILLDTHLYITALLVLSACVGYYVFREYLQEGYFQKVWFSEYSRFTNNIMPWHEQPFWFYLVNMYQRFYTYYVWLVPFSLLGFWAKDEKVKAFTKLGWLFCGSYFLLISYPTVKLEWYDAPLYPVLSILLGILVHEAVVKLVFWCKIAPTNYIFLIFIALFFAIPYYKIYQQNSAYLPQEPLEQDGYAIRTLHKTMPQLTKYKVLLTTKHIEHIDQANFYIKALNHYDQYHIQLINHIDSVQIDDMVLCSQSENIEKLYAKFKISEIVSIHQSKLMKIQ